MKYLPENKHIIIGCFIASVVAVSASAFIYTQYNDNEVRQVQTESDLLTTTTASQKESISIKGTPSPEVRLDMNELFVLVNNERTKANLAPLVRDPLLDKSAEDKCNHMVVNSYWSHTAPDGTKFESFINKYNGYNTAGENLARNFQSASSAVSSWMNSPTHKKNILNAAYENVGYAKCTYGQSSSWFANNTIIVQHFADNPFN